MIYVDWYFFSLTSQIQTLCAPCISHTSLFPRSFRSSGPVLCVVGFVLKIGMCLATHIDKYMCDVLPSQTLHGARAGLQRPVLLNLIVKLTHIAEPRVPATRAPPGACRIGVRNCPAWQMKHPGTNLSYLVLVVFHRNGEIWPILSAMRL